MAGDTGKEQWERKTGEEQRRKNAREDVVKGNKGERRRRERGRVDSGGREIEPVHGWNLCCSIVMYCSMDRKIFGFKGT